MLKAFKLLGVTIVISLLLLTPLACKSVSAPTPTPEVGWWYIPYGVAGGQIVLHYSLLCIRPFDKVVQFSENQAGCITIQISKTVIDGAREVRINQSDWSLKTILVPDFMAGIDMSLNITLTQDATGTLYTQDGIGDVTMTSTSAAGRTPMQQNVYGDSIKDSAGSMLIPLLLNGQAETSIGQTVELPLNLIFSTGHITNIITEPSQGEGMNGSTLTSNGIPFAENGGVAPYVGTPGTITTTGTGNCLGIKMVGLSIDFQVEIKLVLEPVAACKAAPTPTPTSTPGVSTEWFDTEWGGVSKYDGTHWTTYDTSNRDLTNDVVFAIAIDSAGNK